jgi:hypothetical protein
MSAVSALRNIYNLGGGKHSPCSCIYNMYDSGIEIGTICHVENLRM